MTATGHERLLIRALIASQFAPPFMFSGVAVALPTMGADLGAGATSLGLVETLFLAGSVAFLLPVGRLADVTDKRTLYKLGLLAFGVSSALIGALSSVPLLLALRLLQGIAAATLAATGSAILADIVPVARRGRAFGSSVGAIYAGLTLGPICAGLLVDLWGWRAVFLAGSAALLGGYALVRAVMPSSWQPLRQPVHLGSAVLVVAAVLSLVAGAATVHQGLFGTLAIGAGAVLAVGFVLLQSRLEHPLVDVRAVAGNEPLRDALLVQLLLYTNAFASVFLLSIYMQVSLGHPARTSGGVIALGTLLMAAAAPFAGRLADRHRPQRIATLGVACVLVSTLLATRLRVGSSLSVVVLVLSVQGLGFALFSSPNMTRIMNSAASGSTGMASALAAKSRSLGMLAGMLVTALLTSLALGDDPVAQHPERFVGVVRTTFAILAGLVAVALGLSLLGRSRD